MRSRENLPTGEELSIHLIDRCQSQSSSFNCQDSALNKTQGDISLLCPQEQIESSKQGVDKNNRKLGPAKKLEIIWTNKHDLVNSKDTVPCQLDNALYVK